MINYISSYRKIGKIIKADGITVLHTQWVIFSPVDYYFLNKFKKKNCVKLINISFMIFFHLMRSFMISVFIRKSMN